MWQHGIICSQKIEGGGDVFMYYHFVHSNHLHEYQRDKQRIELKLRYLMADHMPFEAIKLINQFEHILHKVTHQYLISFETKVMCSCCVNTDKPYLYSMNEI